MEAEAPHFRLGPPAAYQLHGLRSQRGCPRIAPRSRAALEDQRRESPAGQLQCGREPCGAGADDQDLDLLFFLSADEGLRDARL